MREWPSGTNSKGMKKIAARHFRRSTRRDDFVANGNMYRKYFDHYDINDFK